MQRRSRALVVAVIRLLLNIFRIRQTLLMSAKKESARSTKKPLAVAGASVVMAGAAFAFVYSSLPDLLSVSYTSDSSVATLAGPPPIPPLDTFAYDLKLLELAHIATSSPWYQAFLHPEATSTAGVSQKWPVRAPYPRDSRALLPFNRIVAYYGNFYSKAMGALGEYEPDDMLARLTAAAAEWQAADPSTPVIPAIHYIAIVAQGSEGRDGKYRSRMPDDQLDKGLALAEKVNGIFFIDLQVGLSNVESEVAIYEDYLKRPDVHLALDPEFAMQTSGKKPGRVIGTLDAADINYAAEYLAGLVRQYDLPPKILVVHRFTHDMLTNYKQIRPLPEVQIVIDMDGWGGQAKKKGTYNSVIYPEPVQFTGFKLFYKNDALDGEPLLSPRQVLELTPAPSYIQYQ